LYFFDEKQHIGIIKGVSRRFCHTINEDSRLNAHLEFDRADSAAVATLRSAGPGAASTVRRRAAHAATRFPFSPKVECATSDDHGNTPDQKSDIPIDPLSLRHGLVDVVELKELMIDDALDHIERSETHQDRSGQQFTRPPQMRPVRRPPQQQKARDDENIGAGVKNAVPQRVELQRREIHGRVEMAHHVMPLQDLVKHDPVEKAAQSKAEQDTGRGRKLPLFFVFALVMGCVRLSPAGDHCPDQ